MLDITNEKGIEIFSTPPVVLGATNIKCPKCGMEIFSTELCPCIPRDDRFSRIIHNLTPEKNEKE